MLCPRTVPGTQCPPERDQYKTWRYRGRGVHPERRGEMVFFGQWGPTVAVSP